ncbi:hypothetical protein MUK42_13165 [Musa troglodytarum]|uniref:Uncharacterized protein n=1 Tax=Musa troglodytarum TaxID=320322 RepID=A0A9E7GLE2_9LILI|nr:hypothetical protein MUK42_13165 [Musa troglodytarum]
MSGNLQQAFTSLRPSNSEVSRTTCGSQMSARLQIFSSFHGYNISLVRSRAVGQGITSPLSNLHRHASRKRTGRWSRMSSRCRSCATSLCV